MTDIEIKTVIAERLGWKYGEIKPSHWFPDGGSGWYNPSGGVTFLPLWTSDLREMNKAEMSFWDGDLGIAERYISELHKVCKRTSHYPEVATALQRAEAFARTIGKWKE